MRLRFYFASQKCVKSCEYGANLPAQARKFTCIITLHGMTKKLTKKVKKQLLNIGVLVILIGVTLLVVFLTNDIDIHDVGVFLSSCNPWYIVAAFGGLLGYILFEAVSLGIISRTVGYKPKVHSAIAYSTSDLYYSAITPSASGGQPASMFYMMRDGASGGTAGFVVLANLVGYTVATIIVGVVGVVMCPWMFGAIGHWLAKTLVIIGFVIQAILLAILLLCLFRARIILAIGKWGIAVLAKIRIFKHPEKQVEKLENVINNFRECRSVMKRKPLSFIFAMFFNVLQRASQTLIPCFVCLAAAPEVDFLKLFSMQAYVLIGYNSIPLPGGTGVYEYLYPNIFGIGDMFDAFGGMKFILSAMMVSRAISYYMCMIVCGIYTLVYHAVGIKNIKADDPPENDTPQTDDEENSELEMRNSELDVD